jgi:hypothetical protein
MCLGELVWPDHRVHQDYRKIIMHNSVHINQSSFQFYLPGHKADWFFDGNEVIMHVTTCADDLLSSFSSYIFD